jgi:hypothetical protein
MDDSVVNGRQAQANYFAVHEFVELTSDFSLLSLKKVEAHRLEHALMDHLRRSDW